MSNDFKVLFLIRKILGFKNKFIKNLIFELFFSLNLISLIEGGIYLGPTYENQIYSYTKELPKEYLILKLRVSFNKDLYEKKIISFDIYNKMQNLLIKKMDQILLKYKT